MKSLSRVIKFSFYSTMENKKVIELPQRQRARSEEETNQEPQSTEEISQSSQADDIVKKAEAEAELLLREANQRAEEIVQEARQEVDAWWEQRRREDEEIRAQIQQEGYEQGIEIGKEEGRRLVYDEYATALQQAAVILEEAPALKRRVIAEAEPFLLELAIEIARKVIGDHLAADKESIISFIRNALSRTQEYKTVTVAVSPDVYSYVQENRAKLLEVLDSQVEMTIIPDDSITDGGVVIRTTMGSVDARVDTQLEEIKKALLSALAEEDGTQ